MKIPEQMDPLFTNEELHSNKNMVEDNINPINVNYSDEVNEIITAVPSWILRLGITLVFSVLVLIIVLAAFIRYPEVIKTPLKVNSLNSPKSVITLQQGKLVKILVKEGQIVNNMQALAYIESTANHNDIITFQAQLHQLQHKLNSNEQIMPDDLDTQNLNLGELQINYQSFYQEYLNYVNTQAGGFYLKQKTYLENDLNDIKKLQAQINQQQKIQSQEYANAEEEYQAYIKLKSKNVISNQEFKQQENKYLASKYPLQQSSTALLNNKTAYLAKEKEIATLNNTIKEQQFKFKQALNSLINETAVWMKKYILQAPLAGKIGFAGIIQENQHVVVNQEIFIVNPGNTAYFGEVQIPQYNMGKIALGQRTLVKLRSFPFEEYGMINGKISYITDVAYKDSVFIAKIDFKNFEQKSKSHPIILKPGMMADAEIITLESSLLQRFLRNISKILNSGT